MTRDQQAAGNCDKCGAEVECTYNLFEKDELRIDSWDHKCRDCGQRKTQAYRSDDSDLEVTLNPLECPFCGRTAG